MAAGWTQSQAFNPPQPMTENPPSPFFADLIARGYLENDVVKDAHEKSGFRLTAKAIVGQYLGDPHHFHRSGAWTLALIIR